jgi:hypothetical protein
VFKPSQQNLTQFGDEIFRDVIQAPLRMRTQVNTSFDLGQQVGANLQLWAMKLPPDADPSEIATQVAEALEKEVKLPGTQQALTDLDPRKLAEDTVAKYTTNIQRFINNMRQQRAIGGIEQQRSRMRVPGLDMLYQCNQGAEYAELMIYPVIGLPESQISQLISTKQYILLLTFAGDDDLIVATQPFVEVEGAALGHTWEFAQTGGPPPTPLNDTYPDPMNGQNNVFGISQYRPAQPGYYNAASPTLDNGNETAYSNEVDTSIFSAPSPAAGAIHVTSPSGGPLNAFFQINVTGQFNIDFPSSGVYWTTNGFGVPQSDWNAACTAISGAAQVGVAGPTVTQYHRVTTSVVRITIIAAESFSTVFNASGMSVTDDGFSNTGTATVALYDGEHIIIYPADPDTPIRVKDPLTGALSVPGQIGITHTVTGVINGDTITVSIDDTGALNVSSP